MEVHGLIESAPELCTSAKVDQRRGVQGGTWLKRGTVGTGMKTGVTCMIPARSSQSLKWDSALCDRTAAPIVSQQPETGLRCKVLCMLLICLPRSICCIAVLPVLLHRCPAQRPSMRDAYSSGSFITRPSQAETETKTSFVGN